MIRIHVIIEHCINSEAVRKTHMHAQNKICMQLPCLTSYSLFLFSGLTDVQAC